MKKIIVIILSILLLTSCASGGNVSDASDVSRETSDVSAESRPADPLENLPNADFNEKGIVIWTTEPAVASAEFAYDTVLQLIMQDRIDAIENKYNTSITVVKKTAAEINAGLNDPETAPDLVIMPNADSSLNSVNGKFANMWSLPFFNEAAEALDGLAEEQTINNSLYMMTAPFLHCKQNAIVVYANRDMFKAAGLRTPAYAVQDGSWTVDKMISYMEQLSTAAGKDSPDVNNDIFGFTSVNLDTKTLMNCFWNGSGIDYFGETMGRPLEAGFDYAQGAAATDAVKRLWASKTILQDTSDVDTKKMFLEGKSLFCVTHYSAFTGENRITDFDWEVLPLPKTEAGQQEYSSPLTEALCISVPARKEDSYRSGLILASWILSSRDVEDALERYFITYTSTDNINTVMTERIFDTVDYTKTELWSGVYTLAEVGKGLIASSVTDTVNFETYIGWQKPQVDVIAEIFK